MSQVDSSPQRAVVDTPAGRTPAAMLFAAFVLAVKAALGLWAALALLAASPTHHRRFLGEVLRERHRSTGILLLVLVAAAVVVLVGLVRRRLWAWLATLALEAVGVVLALSRLGSHAGPALLSLALSAVVVAALFTPASVAAIRRRTR